MAPGQLSFHEMEKIYRFDEINTETEVFGVIGDPVGHSLSPLLHNRAFQKVGVNAVYVPIRIPADTLTESLDACDELGIRGFSVTIPHKEKVLDKATELSANVRAMGAANTLLKSASGTWAAFNTDCDAALQTMRLGLGANENDPEILRGKRVLVLGAGGVARAIAYGLIEAGAAVTITNRTAARAADLAAHLGCQVVQWGARSAELADIIVNCTSIGMHPDVEDAPFQMNWINEGLLVFDTVYNPENTLLLKQAREYDWKTASGLEMFVRQAAAQFEMFTSQAAPIDNMRTTLRRWLSPVSYDNDED